jgi:hypothetical protein
MTDQEVMKLLRAVRRVEMQELGQWLARERKDCVDFMRARQIALNPDAATPEENAQIARCPHCARLLKQLQEGLAHPSLWSLVRWSAKCMDGEDAKGMAWHVNDDACRRCNRLLRSSVVLGLAAALRQGTRTAEQVRALADAAVGIMATLPAPAGAFAAEDQAPHLARQERCDGGLVVSVRDSAGELAVSVSSPGQALDGKKVAVEVIGEKESLTGELTLRSQGSAGCGGRVVFGSFSEAVMKLGMDYFALAVPEDDGWHQVLQR